MRFRRGMTLIEVVAGVAAIGVIGTVAMPALSNVRARGGDAANIQNQRTLAMGQMVYMNANDGFFAGPNTTGWGSVPGASQDASRYVGNTSATTPTDTHDWISPIVGDAFGFRANRAERMQDLLMTFRDPLNGLENNVLFGEASDRGDYTRVLVDQGGFPAVSYLSPSAFHYWGTLRAGFQPGVGFVDEITPIRQQFGGVPYFWGGALANSIEVPSSHRPTIDRVGTQLSAKVLIADGTRYVADESIIDINVNPVPNIFGNLTDNSPSFRGSTAWGRQGPGDGLGASARRPAPVLRENLAFSSPRDRRNGSALTVTYFDGSSRLVGVPEAKARLEWWYPTGASVKSIGGLEPEAASRFARGDVLP